MAKDPAFLFYPGDFTTGTQFFTDEQVGKYIRLLLAQHQLGHLEEKHMIMICKTYDKDIFSKFDKDLNGLYFNKRLEEEIVKRKNYTDSRRNNRTKENNISKSYDNHMENRNKDIVINSSNTIKNEKKNLTETFLNDLPNSTHLETISKRSGLTIDQIKEKIPDFTKSASLEYKTPMDLVNHFLRWLNVKRELVDKKKYLLSSPHGKCTVELTPDELEAKTKTGYWTIEKIL